MTVEILAKKYEHNSVVRALVQLIPMSIGSAVDVAIITRVQNIRTNRARVFFDELAKGDEKLRPELLENNEFLHCYFATASAALKSRRAEKIQALARLLLSSTTEGKFEAGDEYEEFLSILDELSFRELQILTILDGFESRYPHNDQENDYQRASRFWDKFVKQVIKELCVQPAEFESILTRLTRSGCYESFAGIYVDYTGGQGKISPLFHRLKDLALDSSS